MEQSLSQTQLEQIAAFMKGGQTQTTPSQDHQRPAIRQIAGVQPAIPLQQQLVSAPLQQAFGVQQQVMGAPQQPAFGGPQHVPAFGGQQQVQHMMQQNQQQPPQTIQQQQPPQTVQQFGGLQVGQMTSQGAGEPWPTIQQAGWAVTSQPGTGGPRSWM